MRTYRLRYPEGNFFVRHSLSLVTVAILVTWIVLYSFGNEKTHLGSFFGNAIADWTGVVAAVVITKFLHEAGSAESTPPKGRRRGRVAEFFHEHSLTIFLLVTFAGWVALYASMDSESKWGQVVGNIVSEWTQLTGMVLLTKKLIEPGSKESKT